ncbi:hypothetical protein [Oryzomicrobium sp.]|uniref:hypothetical protein n=1 Tax=Oryzomicrobium sp. TaxID=1911578 RepID=UPI002FE1AAFA
MAPKDGAGQYINKIQVFAWRKKQGPRQFLSFTKRTVENMKEINKSTAIVAAGRTT